MKKILLLLVLPILFCFSVCANEINLNNSDIENSNIKKETSFFIFGKYKKPNTTSEDISSKEDNKIRVDINQFIKEQMLDYTTNQTNTTMPLLR